MPVLQQGRGGMVAERAVIGAYLCYINPWLYCCFRVALQTGINLEHPVAFIAQHQRTDLIMDLQM